MTPFWTPRQMAKSYLKRDLEPLNFQQRVLTHTLYAPLWALTLLAIYWLTRTW